MTVCLTSGGRVGLSLALASSLARSDALTPISSATAMARQCRMSSDFFFRSRNGVREVNAELIIVVANVNVVNPLVEERVDVLSAFCVRRGNKGILIKNKDLNVGFISL